MYVYMYTDAILFKVLAISCANYWSALPGAKIPQSKRRRRVHICNVRHYRVRTVGPIDQFSMCFGPVNYMNIYTHTVIEQRKKNSKKNSVFYFCNE
jgi:hypothetical protein